MQQTIDRQNQTLREEINYIHDSVDAMFGIRTGARYPTKRPVLVSGGTVNNNHVSINNSQIGLLNAGNIDNLNQTIDSLYSASQKDLATTIQAFSQAVLNEESLTDDQKNETLESLDVITKELFQKPETRKKSVAKILFEKISGVAGLAANTLTIWQILMPILQKFF
ncbi:MAG: hypothetical protein WCF77_01500 [Minisyncoccia bacterium]|jgi:hypothetical protein